MYTPYIDGYVESTYSYIRYSTYILRDRTATRNVILTLFPDIVYSYVALYLYEVNVLLHFRFHRKATF